MADSKHSIPASGASPNADFPDTLGVWVAHRAAWAAAKHLVADTKATWEAFDADHMKPLYDAHERGEIDTSEVHKIERQSALLASVHSKAVNAMTFIPAPSLAALHWKITTAKADSLFDGETVCVSAIDAILADVARLGGLA